MFQPLLQFIVRYFLQLNQDGDLSHFTGREILFVFVLILLVIGALVIEQYLVSEGACLSPVDCLPPLAGEFVG